MPDLATLAIRIDSSGVTAASRELEVLEGKSRRVESATQSMASGFSKLTTIVSALAASYALLKMAQLIQESTLLSARVETLGVVMAVVGKNVGLTAQQMENYAQNVKSMGITTQVSRETVIRMVQAQMDLTDAMKLARIAQDAARIGYTNSSDALQKMIYGIQTGQVEVLKTIGLNVNFETSYKKLAAQIGKSTEDLNEQEKVLARTNIVKEAGARISSVYAESLKTVGGQLASLPRFSEEAKLKFGELFRPALMIIITELTKGLKDLNAFFEKANASGDAKRWAETIKTYMEGAVGFGIMLLNTLNEINKVMGKKEPETAMEKQNRLSEEFLNNKKEILHWETLFAKEQTAWYGKASLFGWDLYAQDRKRLEVLKERNAAILVEFKLAGETRGKEKPVKKETIETAKATYETIQELTNAQRVLQEKLAADIAALQEDMFSKFAYEYAKREKIVGKDAEGIKLLNQWAALETEKIWKESDEKIAELRNKSEEEFILNNYKRLEEQTKAIQDAKDSDIKIYLDAIDTQNKSEEEFIIANYARLDKQYKAEQELFENEKKLSIERITLEAALYADLKGYGEKYYEAQKALIDKQAQNFRDAKIDEALITAWVGLKVLEQYAENAKNTADYYSTITGYEDEYYAKKLLWIETARIAEIAAGKDVMAANAKADKLRREAIVEIWDLKNKDVKNTITNSEKMFDAASELFDKESKEYKLMQDLKKAAQIAELAMEVQKNIIIIASYFARSTAAVATATIQNTANASTAVTGAVASVAAQGTVPIVGFAMVAAMIAVMTGVLAMAGIAFGGGGGGGAAAAPAKPASTVLGAAAGAGSESASKAFELLEDTYSMEYEKLTDIYNAMKDLNRNITGLVTSIIRPGGIGSVGGFTGTTLKSDYFGYGGGAGYSSGIGMLDNLLNWIQKGIFGRVETSITAAGIQLGPTTAGGLQAGGGMTAQQYADIERITKGRWFRSDSTEYQTIYKDLDVGVTKLFTDVFKNLGETLVDLAVGLGVDTQAALDYVFPGGKINLKDLDAEGINKAISEFISNTGDVAVKALFGPIISGYQKIGEGLLETAVRLVMNKELILETLKMTGQAFTGTVPEIIAFSESLIEMAGGLDKITEAAAIYFDKFFTDAEKQARLQDLISGTMADVNMVLPGTRAGYRALLEGLDLTTTAGQEAYVALLGLAEGADAYYSALEEIELKRREMEIQLMELTGDAAGALAARRADELAAMDETLRPLQELIWLTEDWATKLQEATSAAVDAINAQISLSKTASQNARRMADSYRDIIDSLAEAQRKIRGGGVAGAKDMLESIFGAAMTGDKTALAGLPKAAEDYLTASLATSQTAEDFARDQAEVLIMLEKAKMVSVAMVDWNEYQATLLEIQTGVIEEIKTELEKPDPSLEILNKQVAMLETIGGLLQAQTIQIVSGSGMQAVMMHDQTGKIIETNFINTAQDAKLSLGNMLAGTQTSQIITGNATADAIKNISNLNTSYSEEMLAALVTGDITQNTNLQNILDANKLTVSLLRQLIDLTGKSRQEKLLAELKVAFALLEPANVAAWEAERIAGTARTAQTEAIAAHVAAQAAAVAAPAVAAAAAEVAKQAAAAVPVAAAGYEQARQAAIYAEWWAGAEVSQVTYDEMLRTRAIAQTAFEALGAAQTFAAQMAAEATATLAAIEITIQAAAAAAIVVTTTTATAIAMAEIAARAIAEGARLKAIYIDLLEKYTKEYPPPPPMAEGGFFAGGWRMVGERGPELEYTGPSDIFSNQKSKALFDNSTLVEEVRKLREEIRSGNYQISKNTLKSAKVLDNTLTKWDDLGMPAVRT